MQDIDIVRDFYNENVVAEWERFDRHPFEYQLALRFLDRYIQPGCRVLDIGGGPGRYALYLANKGCQVTLCDLAPANVEFALEKAREQGVNITALAGDAREIDTLIHGEFDHVLLMGPLYHLLAEEDRVQAIQASLNLLKKGGVLFASFISSYSGMIYAMKYEPQMLLEENVAPLLQLFIDDLPFAGDGFTRSYFIRQQDVLPLMEQFPLEKLHFFGQEGILAPCELNLKEQPPAVREKWLEVAEKVCERENLLSYSEHLMYIGRKL